VEGGASVLSSTGPTTMRRLVITATVLLFLGISLFLPPVGGITVHGWRSLAILCFAIICWATELIPASAVGMGILVLIPLLGVQTYQDTFSSFGAVMLWRLASIYIITTAIQKTGLADRFTYRILMLTGGRVRRTLLFVLLLNFLFVFIIPSSDARTTLFVTVMVGWFRANGIQRGSNIAKAFLLAIPTLSAVTASSVIVGASVDIFAADLFRAVVGYRWTYMTWFLACMPFGFLMTFVIYWTSLRIFKPEFEVVAGGAQSFAEDLKQLGKLKREEKTMLVLFLVLLVFWFTDLSEKIPAEMLIALFLMVPGRWNVIPFREAMDTVRWDILILFGASISLAAALTTHGALGWLAGQVFAQFTDFSVIVFVLVTILLTALIRLGMANMTGAVATLLPLLFSVATSVSLNPVWLGMICVISSSASFFFPAQSSNNLFAYGFGYYDASDQLRFGLRLFVPFILTLMAVCMLYWPLGSIPIRG
jgi:anion transporter